MTLSGLTIGSATIEPEFNPQVTLYTGTFPADATGLTVSASKTDEAATWGTGPDAPTLFDYTLLNAEGTIVGMGAISKARSGQGGYAEPELIEKQFAVSAVTATVRITIKVSLNGTVVTYKITLTREDEE